MATSHKKAFVDMRTLLHVQSELGLSSRIVCIKDRNFYKNIIIITNGKRHPAVRNRPVQRVAVEGSTRLNGLRHTMNLFTI